MPALRPTGRRNNTARLDSLEIQVGDYLGHPPTTAIRPLAELIDDHFIRISTEQRRGVDVVDWVHPSVRDSVIEYLIEHDLERSRFLRAASYPAVLVAISIGGGREGTLTLPLIRTDADWELAEKRVAELVTLGDGDHRLAILQGLLAVIGDSSTTAEQSLRLRRVGARALKELGAAWSDTGPASLPLLSVYFRLSVAARELVPSPDLTPLWDKHLGGARRSLNDVKGSLGQFDAWLDLVFLLRWAEPRFLRIVGFPKDFLELLLEFVERAEQSLEQLEDLDEDELEDVEIGDGDYESFPVEPGPDEATDRQWVEQLVPMLESLSTFLKDQEARLDTAVRGALEHSTTRETRQDRWDSYTSYEQESDGDWRSDREPERFDIVSFFADL